MTVMQLRTANIWDSSKKAKAYKECEPEHFGAAIREVRRGSDAHKAVLVFGAVTVSLSIEKL